MGSAGARLEDGEEIVEVARDDAEEIREDGAAHHRRGGHHAPGEVERFEGDETHDGGVGVGILAAPQVEEHEHQRRGEEREAEGGDDEGEGEEDEDAEHDHPHEIGDSAGEGVLLEEDAVSSAAEAGEGRTSATRAGGRDGTRGLLTSGESRGRGAGGARASFGLRTRAVARATHIIITRMTNGKEKPPRKQKLVSRRQIWKRLNTRGKSR